MGRRSDGRAGPRGWASLWGGPGGPPNPDSCTARFASRTENQILPGLPQYLAPSPTDAGSELRPCPAHMQGRCALGERREGSPEAGVGGAWTEPGIGPWSRGEAGALSK